MRSRKRNFDQTHSDRASYKTPRTYQIPSTSVVASRETTSQLHEVDPAADLSRELPALPSVPKEISNVVFTHKSALPGDSLSKVQLSYERLEFLGDAYIELIATRLVVRQFPQFPVGRLSQQRENLVKNETLAKYSLAYGFDQRMVIAPSDSKLHEQRPKAYTKMMGDLFEAYVAAIVLSDDSSGFQTAEAWLHELWSPRVKAQIPLELGTMDITSKSRLAQTISVKGVSIEYRQTAPQTDCKSEGKTWYHIGAFLNGWGHTDNCIGKGSGLSKQEAGQRAASDALNSLTVVQISKRKAQSNSGPKGEGQ